MKKLIRLTESDIHRIINESVNRVVQKIIYEQSTDTIDSASEKAKEKYEKLLNRYGKEDPRTQQAYLQYVKFKKDWDSEFEKGNIARKSRMLTNREKRQSGERNFISGKGWRNDAYKDNQKETHIEEKPIHVTENGGLVEDGAFLYFKGKIFILRGYVDSSGCMCHCSYDGKRFETAHFISISDEEYKNDLYFATKKQRELLLKKISENGLWWDNEDNYIKKGNKPIEPIGSL